MFEHIVCFRLCEFVAAVGFIEDTGGICLSGVVNGYGGGSCLKASGEPWRTRMESFRESDQGVKDRRDGQPLNDGLQVGGSALLDSGRSGRG